MALTKFTSFNPKDEELGRLMSTLRSVFGPIIDSKILDGNLISFSLPTVGANNTVYHGLNRNPNGFIVVSQNVQATIWWPGQYIDSVMYVRTSAAVTGKAWVF